MNSLNLFPQSARVDPPPNCTGLLLDARMTLEHLRSLVQISWEGPPVRDRRTCCAEVHLDNAAYKTSQAVESSIDDERAKALCLNRLLGMMKTTKHTGG